MKRGPRGSHGERSERRERVKMEVDKWKLEGLTKWGTQTTVRHIPANESFNQIRMVWMKKITDTPLSFFILFFVFKLNGATVLRSSYYIDPTAQLKHLEELTQPHQSRPSLIARYSSGGKSNLEKYSQNLSICQNHWGNQVCLLLHTCA